MRSFLYILLAFMSSAVAAACSHWQSPAASANATSEKPKLTTAESSWIGVYTSPEEIGGYSNTVLSVEDGYTQGLQHRMIFSSDATAIIDGESEIIEPEKSGAAVVDGDKIYVATARGHIALRHGKPSLNANLFADLETYTRLKIKGRIVLMRNDALQAYRQENRLYDYGILIKVADTAEFLPELKDAKHEPIKVLYENPQGGWADPFVNGPNKR